MPSNIKDTYHFINKINNFKVLRNSLSVIVDVKALYTNKPNNKDIAAVKQKHATTQREP